MQHPKAPTTLAVLCLGLALAAEEPAPTPTPVPSPTPRPRTLEEAAAGITLDRSGSDAADEIVISNHNLREMAEGGLVTGCELRGGPRQTPVRPAGDRGEDRGTAELRRKWQQRYRKQQEAIRKLREKQAVLEAEIRVLERAAGRRRDPLRLERARARLEQLAERIALEERRLAELVRAARRDGARPGWFR